MEYHYAKTLCTCKSVKQMKMCLALCDSCLASPLRVELVLIKLMIKLLAIYNHLGMQFKGNRSFIYKLNSLVILEFH